MSPSVLAAAERFLLPRYLAEQCIEALRAHGREGAELFIALTAMVDDEGRTVHFRRGLIPEQTSHATPEGLLVTIDGEAIFKLNRDSHRSGELLAGQMHAHPGRAYHSGADDALALIRLPGGLSIVVPNFATGRLSPRRWSVHQLGVDGVWAPLSRNVDLSLT